ncbi:FHA domain-containing protein [Paraburkholderia strydomiana]|jgi:hypothetical protein|uniref:FHA domain-containing protein n=1 Tax=Paraburkholderia strydomiana TaxID=1245417 RepID=UPI0038B74B70
MVSSTPDASGWQLCFLNGPMSGRTLLLKLGENWVGTGADCEVILPDREIAARQLCLHVGSIAVSVQNQGGAPVLLNGTPLAQMRRALMPGDTVTVAHVKFGIERLAGAQVVPAGAASVGGGKRHGESHHWLSVVLPAWLGGLGSRRLMFALLALWSAFAIAAGSYVAVATRGSFWWSHQSRFERMRDVEGALRQFPELTVEPGQGNAIAVDGYVRDARDRARVAAIVDGFDGVTLGDVYVVNDLLATAQQTLSDTQLKVAYTGRGRMTISGVATRAVWQRVQNFKRDAKPAVEVTDQVVYDDNAGGPLIAASGSAVPVDIAGVYGDDTGTRYVVTRDGRHFFEGATLPSGLMVASIGSGSVTFERNGTRFVVALGPHEVPSPGAASLPAASSAAPAAAGVAMPSS